jgi:hypothetical protein
MQVKREGVEGKRHSDLGQPYQVQFIFTIAGNQTKEGS